MPKKSKAIANGSLSQLSSLVDKAGIQLKSNIGPAIPPAQESSKSPKIPSEPVIEPSDDELFMGAMEGVQRLSWRHTQHPFPAPSPSASQDPDMEARRLMQAAIEGDPPMAIFDHPEYIEGWIGVAGKRFLPKLRNGLYSIQGQIDLHGLSRADAQTAAEEFIIRMSRFRSCCIKIIHGRGINSPTDRATLKESLQRLLSTRRMSHYVVAYASAPSRDGGVGAVYVLLSRQ